MAKDYKLGFEGLDYETEKFIDELIREGKQTNYRYITNVCRRHIRKIISLTQEVSIYPRQDESVEKQVFEKYEEWLRGKNND